MSILTERLAQEIQIGIARGYVQPTEDTDAFLASLENGEDIIDEFAKPPKVSKGAQPE